MADIRNIDGSRYEQRMEELDKREGRRSEYLAGDGGPPHDDDMERRVTRLELQTEQAEKRADRVESKLDKLVETVARIEGRISAMPTTWMVATFMLSFGLALFGFIFLMFRLFLGDASPPPAN